MPKPDLVKVYADSKGVAYRDVGKGFSVVGVIPPESPAPQREILKRVGYLFETGETLNVVDVGPEWQQTGDIITIDDLAALLTAVQIYRNGQLLACGAEFSPDIDVYFVDINTIAFTFSIRSEEVLQIWKNFYS